MHLHVCLPTAVQLKGADGCHVPAGSPLQCPQQDAIAHQHGVGQGQQGGACQRRCQQSSPGQHSRICQACRQVRSQWSSPGVVSRWLKAELVNASDELVKVPAEAAL